MAAPKGNKFWELRSKHGRDKIFETPEIMWEAACEYFNWCTETPLKEDNVEKIRTNGKGEEIKHVPLDKMRAFTMQGLCIFLDVNTVYFNQFELSLKGKTDEQSKDFSKIITRIKEIIYEQKFVGAAAGFLNPNIIARDLGLKDQSIHEIDDKRKTINEIFPSEDELNEAKDK
jgi:hypothetical protein